MGVFTESGIRPCEAREDCFVEELEDPSLKDVEDELALVEVEPVSGLRFRTLWCLASGFLARGSPNRIESSASPDDFVVVTLAVEVERVT